ncbi:MAG: type II toxin-antitoxin system HicB family antitoxin [Gammaproteobacteria bacterium]|nr:type II toxin-antitoxin system HicB family antitoxin [Gammaproteobacteria bacterium]
MCVRRRQRRRSDPSRREALAFHVEGLSDEGEPIPPPRSIEAIKADPEIADWRRGADIVPIPLLLDRGSSRRVNISLDRGLLEAIDDEARLRRMTRSAFRATAARREIDAPVVRPATCSSAVLHHDIRGVSARRPWYSAAPLYQHP